MGNTLKFVHLCHSVHYYMYMPCLDCFGNNFLLKDALYKQHSTKCLESKIEATMDILEKSHQFLKDHMSNSSITISYLEGVAGMRFAMGEVASLLHSEVKGQLIWLMQVTKDVLTDSIINTTNFSEGRDVVGPAVYLIKFIVRQYGFYCLNKIYQSYQWILPDSLRSPYRVSCKSKTKKLYPI